MLVEYFVKRYAENADPARLAYLTQTTPSYDFVIVGSGYGPQG